MTADPRPSTTPVADAIETLRDHSLSWRVEQTSGERGRVRITFTVPLSAIERGVPSIERLHHAQNATEPGRG